VLLLHGFPETSIMWTPMLGALADAGYRAIAFDQRGYSPGARPAATDDYRIEGLVGDALAVADAAGFDRFHVVAHDWGSGIAWTLAIRHPERLSSVSSLSIPHLAAFAAAIEDDADQRRRSRYMLLFRTPWLPETLFCFNGLSLLDRAVWPEHGAAARTEYHAVFSEPRALGAALDWYRAASLDPGPGDVRVGVPALVIWGNRDPAVGRASFEGEKALFTGPLTEVELDAGHWLMETHAPLVTATVLRHIEGI
jgi:pimeloyl-ACP methyl ester carboxylesterase